MHMSQESLEWLNQNVLIGFTEKRGTAWHYRESAQGDEPNHYTGPVPVADVERRLFHWTAEKVPMLQSVPCGIADATGVDDDGTSYRIEAVPNRAIIRRSDTHHVLGVFKDGYVPHQPREWLLENVATLLGESLQIGSAGLLRGGAVAWVQIEASENMVTKSGVEFRPHITAADSFDGSLVSTYKGGATVIVCDNTMEANLREKGHHVKIRHTRYGRLDFDSARDALGIVEQAGESFAADVDYLTSWHITDRQWARFLDSLITVKPDATTTHSQTVADHKRDQLTTLYNSDPRVAPWRGTAFGVLQATNTFAHHVKVARGDRRVERNMLNALTGVTAKTDGATLDLLGKVCA